MDNKLNKIPTKVLLILVFILLTGIVILLRIRQKPNPAEAEWWDQTWVYRNSISVTNNTTQESNVYTTLSIGTSSLITDSKLQADCGDLRFTNQSGNLLDYYIVSGCGTTATSVNINHTTFPAGQQTIYYYYGNSSIENGTESLNFNTEATSYSIGSTSSEEITPGPLAYWKFDEGYGTTTKDSAGSNDAVFATGTSAPSWINDSRVGHALNFDGNDNTNVVDFKGDLSNQFTISFWVKTTDFNTANQYMVEVLSGKPLIAFSYNEIRVSMRDQGDTTWTAVATTTDPLSGHNNQWNYIAITYNDDDTVNIYHNGILAGTGTHTGYIGGWPSSPNFEIGGRTGVFFTGQIDEVKVFGYPLTADQIKADYNQSSSAVLGRSSNSQDGSTLAPAEYCPPGDTASTCSAPIAHWTFNEKVGTTAYDSAAGNYNASFVDAPTWKNSTNCPSGNCLYFDGSNDQLSFSTIDLAEDTPWTVQYWFYQDCASCADMTLGQTAVNQNRLYHTGIGDSYEVRFMNNSAGSVTFSIGQELRQAWHHLAVVCDGSDSANFIAYLNGQPIDDGSNATTRFQIDNIGYPYTTTSYHWLGMLDDIRIYNYARTPSQINWDIRKNQPIGYWKFDEGSGSIAHDEIGDQDGTITGADWTNAGKYGKSLSFDDGTTDRVDLSSDYSQLTQELTVSAWVYPISAPDGTGRVVATTYDWDALPGASRGWNFGNTFGSTDFFHFMVYDSGGSQASAQYNNFFSENLNKWTHVLGTFKASQYARLYINGQLAVEDTSSVPSNIGYSGTYNMRIGARADASSQGDWAGYIDEVKLYPSALSEDAIKLDYNQGKAVVLGSLSTESGGTTPSLSSASQYCQPGSSDSCSPPVGEWLMDDNTGTSTVADTSGNGNTGTMNGSMTEDDWVSGKSGSALDFDGSNDYLSMGSTFSNSTEFTFSSWIKTDTVSQQGIMNQLPTGSFGGSLNIHSDGSLHFMVGGSTGSTLLDGSSPEISANKWHHVTGVFDGAATPKIILYVNGLPIAGSISGTNSIITPSSFQIGNDFNSSKFNGLIDQVLIYDYARTPGQIAIDYNGGKPTAHYPFDEGESTVVHDRMGGTSGNFGSGTSAPSWTDNGKLGKALTFDGTSDYVLVNDDPVNGLQQMSISVWAKVDPSDTTGPIVGNVYGWYYRYGIRLTSGKYEGLFRSSAGTGSIASNTDYSSGAWDHIVVTYDNGNTAIYVNGQLKNTGTFANAPLTQSSDLIEIGSYAYATANNFFKGDIDDVRIYSYPLTARQVQTLYNDGSISFH